MTEILGAAGHGDPHYVRFDSSRYDFNAAGEYIVYDISSQGNLLFQLQGRLGPRLWPATVTLSLAFGIPGQYGYQVSANHRR